MQYNSTHLVSDLVCRAADWSRDFLKITLNKTPDLKKTIIIKTKVMIEAGD